MALDGLNAAAAAAILNDADPDTRTQGVVVSALVPGVLGLAVPLVLAQQGGLLGTTKPQPSVPANTPVMVPDVTGMNTKDASTLLVERYRLRPGTVDAVSDDTAKGLVVSQDPPPKTKVRVGSTVTLTIGLGEFEPDPAPEDDDAAIAKQVDAARVEIEKKIDDNAKQVTYALKGINDAITNLQQQWKPGTTKSGPA